MRYKDPSAIEYLIRKNLIKGATEVSKASLIALMEKMKKISAENEEKFLAEMRQYADYIIRLRPSMASLRNYITIAISELENALDRGLSIEEAKKVFMRKCEELIHYSRNALKRISTYFVELIEPEEVIFTHSYSNTVLECLFRAKIKNIKVIVTESRPSMEGLKTANVLARKDIPVTLIVDAAAGMFIKNADRVVIGADAILPDNSIINKIGTMLLALAAKESGIPLMVVSEYMKKIQDNEIVLEERDPLEMVPKRFLKHKKITVRNIFFERVPAQYISFLITEKGIEKLNI
ncbi:MAG: hypothetical protein QXW86_07290 [Saccharolobus sp.]|uniref:translation initiation factor eIF-2B n=1 Tax=Saccharolobus sp. TaxID=2100761 RepID=UPI00317E86A0